MQLEERKKKPYKLEFRSILIPCVCVISAKTDQAFKEFLDARNPTKQHSSTLESYLIKPVQRVLKYPLLLRELVSLTDGDSEEHYHLTGRESNTCTCTPTHRDMIKEEKKKVHTCHCIVKLWHCLASGQHMTVLGT